MRLPLPTLAVCIITILATLSCSSFIEKDVEAELKVYESRIYILKKDLDIETAKLKKGERVRILIYTSDEWIKVYAYSASQSKLKAERFIALYLFEDDFNNDTFDKKLFKKELYKVFKRTKK